MWDMSNFEFGILFSLGLGLLARIDIRNDVRSIRRMIANELNRRDPFT